MGSEIGSEPERDTVLRGWPALLLMRSASTDRPSVRLTPPTALAPGWTERLVSGVWYLSRRVVCASRMCGSVTGSWHNLRRNAQPGLGSSGWLDCEAP